MKDYSRFSKKKLIEELCILQRSFDKVHEARMDYFMILDFLSRGLYDHAEREIDLLYQNHELKEGLLRLCKILKAVTPQGGI